MKTSNFFNLNLGDFIRGGIVAVLTGIALPVLALIQTYLQQPDFNVLMMDWTPVWVLAVNGGFAGLIGYLTKNLFTSDSGKFLGKVG